MDISQAGGEEPEDKEIIQILTGVSLFANPVLTH